MKDENNKFKKSLLSYFEEKKDGETTPELKSDKLKAQPPQRIPNKITPNPIDDQSAQTNKKISDLGGSIESLIKALNDMSGSTSILKKSMVTNNTINNSVSNTQNPSNKTSNNKMNIFSDIHKTFNKNVINNPSKNIKNTKEISFPKVPKIIQPNNTEKSERFVENLVSTNTTKEKFDRVSKELSHKLTKMSKPKRQYKTTSASKRVPKVIELTKMTKNNKNVFKHLSNKMMTIIPSKTSSKILSSLMNYESNVNNNRNNISNDSTSTNPKVIENKIHSSVEKVNMRNVIGKEKYNIINVPTLAEGGVVDKPTLAMVGEGGRPESITPLDRSTKSNNLEIQKTQTPTASSIGSKSMNVNAALKMEQNQANGAQNNSGVSPVVIDNSNTSPKSSPPNSASFDHSPPKSLLAIQTQTHFPRWRRTMG